MAIAKQIIFSLAFQFIIHNNMVAWNGNHKNGGSGRIRTHGTV